VKHIIVTDRYIFEKCLNKWDVVYNSLKEKSIFFSSQWAYLSAQHFLKNGQLFVIIVEDKGRPIGVAPFKITKKRILGLNLRTLTHLNDCATDYTGILISADANARDVLKEVIQALCKNAHCWDFLHLDNFSSSEKFTRIFFDLAIHTSIRDLSKYVNVNAPFADLQAGVTLFSKKQLKDIERREKRLVEKHKIEYFIATDFSEKVWESFVDFHKARYPNTGFNSEDNQKFYRALLADCCVIGQIEFSYMLVDGVLAAGHFGFRDEHRVYYYIPVYNPRFALTGVGQILLNKMVYHYLNLGYREFDFLRGNESYKWNWCDDARLNFSFVGGSPNNSITTRLVTNIWIAFKCVPILQKLYQRLNYK
jgi:CelD/BcsL family acetyltransferase involved in cellulose biosynthesis